MKESTISHPPAAYLRVFKDNSLIEIPWWARRYACGEHASLEPTNREPQAEVLCRDCAKRLGMVW